MIVNYDRITFIVQALGLITPTSLLLNCNFELTRKLVSKPSKGCYSDSVSPYRLHHIFPLLKELTARLIKYSYDNIYEGNILQMEGWYSSSIPCLYNSKNIDWDWVRSSTSMTILYDGFTRFWYINPLFMIHLKHFSMDKLKLTGWTLGWLFNSRSGCMSCHALIAQYNNTTKLRVENSAQTTFRFSPVRYCAPRL